MDSANGGLQLVPLHHLCMVAYFNCFSPSLKLVRGFTEVCSFAQNDKPSRLLQLKLSFVQYIEILLLWEFFSFAFNQASRSRKTSEPFDDAYLLEHCLVNELWTGKLPEKMIRQFLISLDVEEYGRLDKGIVSVPTLLILAQQSEAGATQFSSRFPAQYSCSCTAIRKACALEFA
jgi:hypothetical protein